MSSSFADFFGLAANVFHPSLEKKVHSQSIGWVLTRSFWCCSGYCKVIWLYYMEKFNVPYPYSNIQFLMLRSLIWSVPMWIKYSQKYVVMNFDKRYWLENIRLNFLSPFPIGKNNEGTVIVFL